jgi:hypothetical protein
MPQKIRLKAVIFSKHFGKKNGISLKFQDNKEQQAPINFDS